MGGRDSGKSSLFRKQGKKGNRNVKSALPRLEEWVAPFNYILDLGVFEVKD